MCVFDCLFYYRRGPNKWRDMNYPVEILDDWCKTNNLPEPEWATDHSSVIVDGTKYTLADFGECSRERSCLVVFDK